MGEVMRRLISVAAAVLLTVWSVIGLVGPASAAPTLVPAPVSSVPHPYVNEGFVLSGKLGTSGIRPVTLQHNGSSWTSDETISTFPDGSYKFKAKTSKAEREFRVVAKATGSLPEVSSGAS